MSATYAALRAEILDLHKSRHVCRVPSVIAVLAEQEREARALLAAEPEHRAKQAAWRARTDVRRSATG